MTNEPESPARIRLRVTFAAACRFELDGRGVLVCDSRPLNGAPRKPAEGVA